MSSLSNKAEKNFCHSLQQLAFGHGHWQVFQDFLDYALLMLKWWDLKAANFAELEKRYTDKKEHVLFFEAYLALGEIAEHNGTGFHDPFGDYFMEHFYNSHVGHFFTPQTICDMIAHMQIGPNLQDNARVADPCCGSGRLLLSAAKINRNALFYAADIDLTCCKMTVINCLLNTLCGEVAWMDSLANKHWRRWQLKKVMSGSGHYLPYYIETGAGTSGIYQAAPFQPPQEPAVMPSGKPGEPSVKKSRPGQLSLF